MWSRVISFLYEKIVIPSQIHVCMYICTSELYFSKNCNFLDQDLCLCLWHPFNALIQISKSNFYTRDSFSGSSQNWRSSIFISLKRKNKTSFIKTLAKRVVNSSISKICIKKRIVESNYDSASCSKRVRISCVSCIPNNAIFF